MDKEEAVKNILFKLLGFVIYLALLGILNIINIFLKYIVLSEVIGFLNNHILIVFLVAITFFFASFFDSMKYPYNLAAPIFMSVTVTIVTGIVLGVIDSVNVQLNSLLITFLLSHSLNVFLLVAAFILLVGYIEIVNKKKAEDSFSKIKK